MWDHAETTTGIFFFFFNLKQRSHLNDQGQSRQCIVMRSFLSFLFFSFLLFFYFSYFIIGDSGNLLCSVAGQMIRERMRRRVAGWCMCVCMFWLRLWHLSFCLHSICWPANLCYVPIMSVCSASGKACVTASEGLRRPWGCPCALAHMPWIHLTVIEKESNKMHVFENQTSHESCSCRQATPLEKTAYLE